MKKLLLLFVFVASFASAQEISLNYGVFSQSESIADVVEGNDLKSMGYLEISGDILEKSKLRLAPVLKLFVYEEGRSNAINGDKQHYAFTVGGEFGYDFSKNTSFAVGYELPIPDQRKGIFEAVVSPTLYLGLSDGFGFKINYDYFINQKLFTYNSLVSAGITYSF